MLEKLSERLFFLSNKWDYLTHVKYFKILLTPVLDFCFPKDMYSKATVTAYVMLQRQKGKCQAYLIYVNPMNSF